MISTHGPGVGVPKLEAHSPSVSVFKATLSETTPAPANPRPDDSVKITSYGIAVGLLGYF